NWRLIRALDPLLRRSDAGRAVFITSGASHRCFAYWGPYSTSKAALEALVKTYAAEIATTPVRVNLFSPGPTRTRMRAQAMPGEDPQMLPARKMLGWRQRGWKVGCTSEIAQKALGTDRAFPGPVYTERLFVSGDFVPAKPSNWRVTEPEIAFTMATDLGARDKPYDVDEI